MNEIEIKKEDELAEIYKTCESEGWSIFDAMEYGFQIQYISILGVFKSDDEAMRYVVKQALNGSVLHRKALAFISKYGKPDEAVAILKAMSMTNDEGDQINIFYVDVPNPNIDTVEWINIESFGTKEEAIAFAQKHFGADENGCVSLVAQG